MYKRQAKVLAAVWDILRDDSLSGAKKKKTIRYADTLLGILSPPMRKETVPEDIARLVRERDSARKRKDYRTADKLRDTIRARGYKVSDDAASGSVTKQ